MANRPEDDPGQGLAGRPNLSTFELFLTCSPPILESFLLQAPTPTILALYHTSTYLRQFLRSYPTSWKYLSFRLHQPGQATASTAHNPGNGPRQSSNYALDQLLIYIVNPFSTCLTSLDLDNTAVSGQILTQTVLHLRRDTLVHLSVRGCKNVSLKYHINPWLMLFGLVNDVADGKFAPKDFQTLALKSLYVYRCRHHRRRPYLPSSLLRKDSDSEPTHELVNICHRLGIWTDTAWCTTPGTRCYRRRGYVTMRVPQDPREVWVVYDRLWRSKNWLGPIETGDHSTNENASRKRKRDCRCWENGEDAAFGEPLGTRNEGKLLPAHLRQSHRKFVEDIACDNCSAVVLERCEQCSVMMHCSGCRKILCASCAFDRPYLRNKNATEEDMNRFWWAPGCAVSPCSMQDQDPTPTGPGMNPAPMTTNGSLIPNLKLKWCCTEPVFSGGGGITFGPGAHPDSEQIRAAPLARHTGWEDPEFSKELDLCTITQLGQPGKLAIVGPGNRWASIDQLFQSGDGADHENSSQVPRNLCDECYLSEHWKVTCKACSMSICLKHDVREKLRVRVCGYRDLSVEKQDFRSRQKLLKFVAEIEKRTGAACGSRGSRVPALIVADNAEVAVPSSEVPDIHQLQAQPQPTHEQSHGDIDDAVPLDASSASVRVVRPRLPADIEIPVRSNSPGSNSTAAPSRASSPTPSLGSSSTVSEVRNPQRRSRSAQKTNPPEWRGCQSFLCPQNRTPGDHRRRCLGGTRQCFRCKVHICEACLVGVGPQCPCRGCRVVSPLNASSSSPVEFFCPNCRWDRIQEGTCKRRLPCNDKKGSKKKNKLRKPISDRVSNADAVVGTVAGLVVDDESAERVCEFFAALQLSDTAGQDTVLGQAAHQDLTAEGEEDIQELEDMGALTRDLVRRIQLLRGQMRPGSLAAAALPDLRVADEEEMNAAAAGDASPTVEGMD